MGPILEQVLGLLGVYNFFRSLNGKLPISNLFSWQQAGGFVVDIPLLGSTGTHMGEGAHLHIQDMLADRLVDPDRLITEGRYLESAEYLLAEDIMVCANIFFDLS